MSELIDTGKCHVSVCLFRAFSSYMLKFQKIKALPDGTLTVSNRFILRNARCFNLHFGQAPNWHVQTSWQTASDAANVAFASHLPTAEGAITCFGAKAKRPFPTSFRQGGCRKARLGVWPWVWERSNLLFHGRPTWRWEV